MHYLSNRHVNVCDIANVFSIGNYTDYKADLPGGNFSSSPDIIQLCILSILNKICSTYCGVIIIINCVMTDKIQIRPNNRKCRH